MDHAPSGILCIAAAAAASSWGTTELVERIGLEALPEQVMVSTVNVRGRIAIDRRRHISRPATFRKACDDQMSKWLCRDLGPDPWRRQAMAG